MLIFQEKFIEPYTGYYKPLYYKLIIKWGLAFVHVSKMNQAFEYNS